MPEITGFSYRDIRLADGHEIGLCRAGPVHRKWIFPTFPVYRKVVDCSISHSRLFISDSQWCESRCMGRPTRKFRLKLRTLATRSWFREGRGSWEGDRRAGCPPMSDIPRDELFVDTGGALSKSSQIDETISFSNFVGTEHCSNFSVHLLKLHAIIGSTCAVNPR